VGEFDPARGGGFCLANGVANPFSDTWTVDFKELLNDPSRINKNLHLYVLGLSKEIREIFERFGFLSEVDRLENSSLLFQLIEKFSNIGLNPESIDELEMDLVFEELVRKFSEISPETAGEHLTPPEIVRLMVELLFNDESEEQKRSEIVSRTIYDPAAGSGGMLWSADEYLRENRSNTQLGMFGQELNEQSYAICKANLLFKGQSLSNISLGNTISDDSQTGRTFDYMLSNPPFGVDWKKIEKTVHKEHVEEGFSGRFGAGLPRRTDASFIFIMHLISKMKPRDEGGSRIGVIVTGAVLFSGDIGTGEDDIRKWILDTNILEGIVALPGEVFMNTRLSSFLLILSNKKNANNDTVVFVDGTNQWELLRRPIGSKSRYLSPSNIDFILNAYKSKVKNPHVSLAKRDDMLYRNFQFIGRGTTFSQSIPLSAESDGRFLGSFQSGLIESVEQSEQIGCRFDFWNFSAATAECPEYSHPLGALLTQCASGEFWDLAINRITGKIDFEKRKFSEKNYLFYKISSNVISVQYLKLQLEFKQARAVPTTIPGERIAKKENLAQWVECPPLKKQNATIDFYESRDQLLLNVGRLEILQWQEKTDTNLIRRSIKTYSSNNGYFVEMLPHPLAAIMHKISCDNNKREKIEGYRAFFECLGSLLLSIGLGVILQECGAVICKIAASSKNNSHKKPTMGFYPKALLKLQTFASSVPNQKLRTIIEMVSSNEIVSILESCASIRNEIAHHGLLTSTQSSEYIAQYQKCFDGLAQNLEEIFSPAELTKQVSQKWDGEFFQNDMVSLTGLASSPFQRVVATSSQPLISGDLYYRVTDLGGDIFVRMFHFVRCVEIVDGSENDGVYFFNSVNIATMEMRFASFQPLIESKKNIDSGMLRMVFQ
ncbi:MAG: class I SAM-dependent DNA methyltransferase, partial [Pseudomonadota bacterium]